VQLEFERFELLLIAGTNAALAAAVWALPADGFRGWLFGSLACIAGLAFIWWRLRPPERGRLTALALAPFRTRTSLPT
jgi:hypothetical protein